MSDKAAEPDFNEHIEDYEKAATKALNALTEVRAYTLAPDEIQDFKAAQYALRNLSPDHGQHDVREVYDD